MSVSKESLLAAKILKGSTPTAPQSHTKSKRMDGTLAIGDKARSHHTDEDAAQDLSNLIQSVLDQHSAQDTIEIDIRGKSSIADFMIITSGRSNRHVGALADYVCTEIKAQGHTGLGVEGLEGCDWVLIDAGDVILHIFRPEVRAFYNLEKIWSVPLPSGVLISASQNVDESA